MKDSDYVKINSVNLLYLIVDKVYGCTEETNGNIYLTLVSTDESKEAFIKDTDLWDKIKNLIECIGTINGRECNSIKAGEYKKNFMKIKFNSDNNLPLNKILKLHNITIVTTFVFQEDDKYYPQVFLNICLYKL